MTSDVDLECVFLLVPLLLVWLIHRYCPTLDKDLSKWAERMKTPRSEPARRRTQPVSPPAPVAAAASPVVQQTQAPLVEATAAAAPPEPAAFVTEAALSLIHSGSLRGRETHFRLTAPSAEEQEEIRGRLPAQRRDSTSSVDSLVVVRGEEDLVLRGSEAAAAVLGQGWAHPVSPVTEATTDFTRRRRRQLAVEGEDDTTDWADIDGRVVMESRLQSTVTSHTSFGMDRAEKPHRRMNATNSGADRREESAGRMNGRVSPPASADPVTSPGVRGTSSVNRPGGSSYRDTAPARPATAALPPSTHVPSEEEARIRRDIAAMFASRNAHNARLVDAFAMQEISKQQQQQQEQLRQEQKQQQQQQQWQQQQEISRQQQKADVAALGRLLDPPAAATARPAGLRANGHVQGPPQSREVEVRKTASRRSRQQQQPRAGVSTRQGSVKGQVFSYTTGSDDEEETSKITAREEFTEVTTVNRAPITESVLVTATNQQSSSMEASKPTTDRETEVTNHVQLSESNSANQQSSSSKTSDSSGSVSDSFTRRFSGFSGADIYSSLKEGLERVSDGLSPAALREGVDRVTRTMPWTDSSQHHSMNGTRSAGSSSGEGSTESVRRHGTARRSTTRRPPSDRLDY